MIKYKLHLMECADGGFHSTEWYSALVDVAFAVAADGSWDCFYRMAATDGAYWDSLFRCLPPQFSACPVRTLLCALRDALRRPVSP